MPAPGSYRGHAWQGTPTVCPARCVTDKAGPEAFIPGAATRTGLNWRQPGAHGHPMASDATQSARTIDLQENAAAVTCQQGNAPDRW